VPWDVEYTDEFGTWWATLSEDEQDRITIAVAVLEEKGPGLGRPWVDTVEGSRWYEHAIPEADALYDEHLAELHDEGTLP
jgi:hypothetical protein